MPLTPVSKSRKVSIIKLPLMWVRLQSALLLLLLSMSASAQTLVVTDDNNQSVTLQAPAQRIITLAPSMTELVFSLGAGDRIVGVMDFSNYPPAANDLPVVGRFDMLDMEQIVALQPDLIVAWRSGNPRSSLQRLQELGFTVYTAEPESLRSIASHLQRLGVLTGTETRANALAEDFIEQLDATSRRYADDRLIDVFYQVWDRPLVTVGGSELINDMIEVCGGRNVFRELGTGPKVNLEDVLLKEPEVIIASGSDENSPTWLEDWRRWSQLPAVANNHLYTIPPDLVQRHSLRALQGLDLMCQHIDKAR